jgi:hypothetical protein
VRAGELSIVDGALFIQPGPEAWTIIRTRHGGEYTTKQFATREGCLSTAIEWIETPP